MSQGFDYWVCDNCHKTYSAETASQNTVRVQQRSERILGTEQVYRPVETLVICGTCLEQIRRERGRHL